MRSKPHPVSAIQQGGKESRLAQRLGTALTGAVTIVTSVAVFGESAPDASSEEADVCGLHPNPLARTTETMGLANVTRLVFEPPNLLLESMAADRLR